MTLHIISRAPHISSSFRDCLDIAGGDDAILLIQDGIYGAANVPMEYQGACYALRDDIEARGMGVRIPASVVQLSYSDFVTLCTQHQPIQSW